MSSSAGYPLSFAQEGLWLLNALNPTGHEYNLCAAYRVVGPLDLSALDGALTRLVRRHDVLSSRIAAVDGAPRQYPGSFPDVTTTIHRPAPRFPASDVARTATAAEWVDRLAATPFRLDAEPLLRSDLVELADDDHVWVLVLHHIVCDGGSLAAILAEIEAGYTAELAGGPTTIDPVHHRFAELAARERQRWRDLDRGTAHALQVRADLIRDVPALILPIDHRRPVDADHLGGRCPIELSPELHTAVLRMAREHRVTPFMAHLAAFSILLHRHTSSTSFAIGVPVRSRADDDVVGFFVNTVVVVPRLSSDDSVETVLHQVRDATLDAMEHRDVPFEEVVRATRATRSLDRNPIFQVMAAAEHDVPVPALDGLQVSRFRVERRSAQFDLGLNLRLSEGVFDGDIEYASALFSPATIARWAGHYAHLCASMVEDPQTAVGDLRILGDDELGAVSWDWPRGAALHSDPACLHDLVLARAADHPDAIAVDDRGTTFDYDRLVRDSTALAELLRSAGVSSEVPVAILLERSYELVVAELAVLTTGGVCVPVDPQTPAARLRAILDDARPALLLASDDLAVLGETLTASVLVLTRDARNELSFRGAPRPRHDTGTKPDRQPEQLAYLLYTSGSTGHPKGVEIPHRALTAFLRAVQQEFAPTPNDRVLQFAGVAVDARLEDLYYAIAFGGTCVIRDDVVDTPARFWQSCSDAGITLVVLPAVYWNHLTEHGRADLDRVPPQLRLVTAGGDRISPTGLRFWNDARGNRPPRLVNEYGPTESMPFCVSTGLGTGTREGPHGVPIGRPLPGVRAYVLDNRLRPVPIGAGGELCIGGPVVARGYRGLPAETARAFVPDPFSDEPETRLYCTGDLARWTADGVLEFLGRLDDQLKIRGFRVEPNEVEQQLRTHPAVVDAVAVGSSDGAGDAVLDAWVRWAGQDLPGSVELDSYLRTRLPDPMVPRSVTVLDTFPMTPSGKVDRAALRATRAGSSGQVENFPPACETERRVLDAAGAVLGIRVGSVRVNFFEAGGHSLHAVQLATRLSHDFGVDISVRDVLLHQVLGSLADRVRGLRNALGPPAAKAVSASSGPSRGTPAEQTGRPAPRSTTVDHRPLLTLLESGQISPIDAACVSCIPGSLPARRGLSMQRYVDDWCQGVPLVSGIRTTPAGRIALIMIPFPEDDLYLRPADAVDAVLPGLRLAGGLGASAVSLINLLPSATGYGAALRDAIRDSPGYPALTTGHGATTAAVVLNIERAMQLSARRLPDEHLLFLGLGSIGVSTLRLALDRLPHPGRLSLCDLFSRTDHLDELRDEVVGRWGFTGELTVLPSASGEVPSEVYEASVVLGATNVPDLLDVDRLRPGTVLIDDSAPHCVDKDAAVQRVIEAGDLFCIEGGELRTPGETEEHRYVPGWASHEFGTDAVDDWFSHNTFTIGGCVLSAALAARHAMPLTIGPVTVEHARAHLDLLHRLRFGASDPEFDDFLYPSDFMSGFADRFGR